MIPGYYEGRDRFLDVMADAIALNGCFSTPIGWFCSTC